MGETLEVERAQTARLHFCPDLSPGNGCGGVDVESPFSDLCQHSAAWPGGCKWLLMRPKKKGQRMNDGIVEVEVEGGEDATMRRCIVIMAYTLLVN